MRRRITASAALAGAAVAGAVAAVAVRGGAAAPAAAAGPRVSTATVVRTTLSTSVLAGGTLGYAPARPVINRLPGIYTALPEPGTVIRPGHALYRVNGQPVILLAGRVPAWRPFAPGMTAGPDVRELQAGLIAAGDAAGLLTAPTGQLDLATSAAVRRWQAAEGWPVTGQVGLGQVVFLPGPVRVGALSVAPGSDATPGQVPYQVSTDRRVVTVPVSPDLPRVGTGQRVTIVLPSQRRTPGTVTAVGPAPAAGPAGAGGAARRAGTSGLPAGTTGVLTVTPRRPAATGTSSGVPVQVALTVQSARHVLAVPVSALLALAGGGYGLEIERPGGGHHLVGVTTGLFAGGRVQVSGAGIRAGTTVVVAQ
ncbi:MAG TPA: peptidoglycan-binding protein [Streptosporangiaceae bacterium]|nr:peptidoglycan-binding protein [Streptosporangiaceae bacterium]